MKRRRPKKKKFAGLKQKELRAAVSVFVLWQCFALGSVGWITHSPREVMICLVLGCVGLLDLWLLTRLVQRTLVSFSVASKSGAAYGLPGLLLWLSLKFLGFFFLLGLYWVWKEASRVSLLLAALVLFIVPMGAGLIGWFDESRFRKNSE